MIIYVESNFVLEVAFAQEESQACEQILDLAEAGRVDLILPAFSISEPYDALRRREARRSKLHDDVARELGELRRTASYAEQVERLLGPLGLLVQSSDDETSRLDDALKRLVDKAELVSVDAGILVRATGLREERGLSPQDAMVYSSVLQSLEKKDTGEEKRFLNRNTRDFLTPDIQADLEPFSCRVIPTFSDGLAWLRAALN